MDQAGQIWATYKVPIILGSVSILLAGVSIVLLVKSTQTANPIQFSQASSSGTMQILIDVAGAVTSPGVYRLSAGARVEDAIVAAGGLDIEADAEWIAKNMNRAMQLTDGAKLYIPKSGESETSHNVRSIVTTLAASSSNGSVVSINMSSQSELEGLPGVGPVTAQKILDNRPYANLDELVKKKAMSQSLFDKLRPQLSL